MTGGVNMNSTRLCGIDSSTSATSISLFVDGKFVDYKLIEIDKKQFPTQWDRLNPMIKEIGKSIESFQPTIIYQEDSWKGKNVDTCKCLSTILGAVRYWAITNNCEYYRLMPSQWRAKLNLQKYEAERPELKNITMEFIKDKYGIEVPTDDVSDSIAIGLAGLKFYGIN